MADSICRKQSKLILDSLYNLQSEYKIVMYSVKAVAYTDKPALQNIIDSLDLEKQPYRKTIQSTEAQEARWAASCQCITSLKTDKTKAYGDIRLTMPDFWDIALLQDRMM